MRTLKLDYKVCTFHASSSQHTGHQGSKQAPLRLRHGLCPARPRHLPWTEDGVHSQQADSFPSPVGAWPCRSPSRRSPRECSGLTPSVFGAATPDLLHLHDQGRGQSRPGCWAEGALGPALRVDEQGAEPGGFIGRPHSWIQGGLPPTRSPAALLLTTETTAGQRGWAQAGGRGARWLPPPHPVCARQPAGCPVLWGPRGEGRKLTCSLPPVSLSRGRQGLRCSEGPPCSA